MRGQAGFWDIDERYVRLSAAGDPLPPSARPRPQASPSVCRHLGKGRNTARHGSTEAHLARFEAPLSTT
ncbi:hypothetical protein EB815_32370 [Mesorhizobium loti]|uniref:Uncharacterized protein n=1 Tax=Mesorhizobium erdmanii TaxID=1777866 RepID=A0A6M7UTF2_9HYPH|nr:hypothetical protein EB815_32370 [Mesorhizobium loti]QKC79283.1 hypothetical protein EB233_30695 [Mesorhizobium erdmanii]